MNLKFVLIYKPIEINLEISIIILLTHLPLLDQQYS